MPRFVAGPVRVRVPATSANLGPGFDALGLALGLHDEVVVEVTGGGLAVDVAGEGAADVPRTEDHLVVRALRAAFDRLGGQPPGLAVSCTNRIPHSRGLGSSAAAIVAGVVAARSLAEDGAQALGEAGALDLAAAMEGHPDNVAACLLGGLIIAWADADAVRAARLDPAPGLAPVAFVPADGSSTAAARRLLPEHVSHADASANAARAALLVHALTVCPELLFAATEDRLHQPYRAPGMPASARLLAELRAAGVPAVVSGAGPTVLAFAAAGTDLASYGEGTFRVLPLPVDRAGATATALAPAPAPRGTPTPTPQHHL